MTFTGWINGISGYLNSFGSPGGTQTKEQQESVNGPAEQKEQQESVINPAEQSDEDREKALTPAIDFTLVDQYGNEHTLSDYKGKVVFLNFWATWCPPCREEMPDIEAMYQEYNQNQEDVIFLGVANPKSEKNPNTREVEKDGVIEFLEENNLTFPVLFDETGEVFNEYAISALPTTFMIDKNGNIYGYAPGMLTKDIMKNIIQQTLESTNE